MVSLAVIFTVLSREWGIGITKRLVGVKNTKNPVSVTATTKDIQLHNDVFDFDVDGANIIGNDEELGEIIIR